MRKQQNRSLLESIASGFKKAIAVSTFTLAGLMSNSGCTSEAKLHKNISDSVAAYGRKKIYEGDLEAGIKYLKEAEEIHELDATDAYKLGMAYRKKKDFSNAVTYLRKATESDLRHFYGKKEKFRARAFFELANTYLEGGYNEEKATECLEEAVDIEPDNKRYKKLLIELRGITYYGLNIGYDWEDEISFGLEILGNSSGEDKSFLGGCFFGERENEDMGIGDIGLSLLMFYKLNDYMLIGGSTGFCARSEGPDETNFLFAYSADIRFINNDGFFSIGHHNTRGLTIGFGAGF
ncbi:tetratricopeptide repeat protein [Candidatus Woesearchaeota archaeon]|nr:tetratricopeptide repeat protein [Candidatus Woesearchaeota archaeon]